MILSRRFASMTFCFLISILFAGCSNKRPDALKVLAGTDCYNLQKKAESFVPTSGTRGGELVLAAYYGQRSLNPYTATYPSSAEITGLLYDGLVRINGATQKIEPALCERWEFLENGHILKLHLRHGLRWSDSVPISAADVAFTFNDIVFNRSQKLSTLSTLWADSDSLPRMTIIDSLTIECRTGSTCISILNCLTFPVLPYHKYAKYVASGIFPAALSVRTNPDSIVCSGPFVFESYIPGQKIILARNPLYYRTDALGTHLPYLDKIVFTTVSDHADAALMFARGETDYLAGIAVDKAILDSAKKPQQFSTHTPGPARGTTVLTFNQNTALDPTSGKPFVDSNKTALFTNAIFRKAISTGLNRQNMIGRAFGGEGTVLTGPLSPSDNRYASTDVALYPFSKVKAQQLLKDGGFTLSENKNVLTDPCGNVVSFSLLVSGGNAAQLTLADCIRTDCAALGIRITIDTLEYAEIISKLSVGPYAWDAALLSFSGSMDPWTLRTIWHSRGAFHLWYPDQHAPLPPWQASIDSIFDVAGCQSSDAQKTILYDRWQRIASEELPFIFLVAPERILAISNKVKNICPSVYGGLLHNIEWLYK